MDCDVSANRRIPIAGRRSVTHSVRTFRCVTQAMRPHEPQPDPGRRVFPQPRRSHDEAQGDRLPQQPPVRRATPASGYHRHLPSLILTRREQEILTLLCQRQTNAEMAAALFLSPRTVETHVAHVIDKLGAANRREAAAIAVRRGLV